MKWRFTTCVILAAMALAGGLAASASRAGEDHAPASAGVPTIDDLAFMAGGWSGEMFGGVGEEYWTSPNGGSILAAFRLIRDGETAMTEYILILEEKDGVILRFKHFNNDYTTWEKDAPLTFRLTEASDGRAVFITPNPEQRLGHLIYRVEGDTLRVKVGAGQDIANDQGAMNLTFTRLH